MNGRLELRIITQPYSEVYWGYFRRLVFENSLTKLNKISSFSYFVVICFLPLSHIPLCYHANPPDFPRLIGPREFAKDANLALPPLFRHGSQHRYLLLRGSTGNGRSQGHPMGPRSSPNYRPCGSICWTFQKTGFVEEGSDETPTDKYIAPPQSSAVLVDIAWFGEE